MPDVQRIDRVPGLGDNRLTRFTEQVRAVLNGLINAGQVVRVGQADYTISPSTFDHSELTHLGYAASGHTGFAGRDVPNTFADQQTIAFDHDASPGQPALVLKDTSGSGNVVFVVIDGVTIKASLDGFGNAKFETIEGDGAAITGLDAAALATGFVPTARLGTGTADEDSVLKGDNTWGPAALAPAASVAAIDGLAVGSTLLFTAPVGRAFVPLYVVVRCVDADAVTAAPTAGVGVVAGSDNVFATHILSGLTAGGTLYAFTLGGAGAVVPPGGSLYLWVGTGGSGTTLTLEADVVGYVL